MRVDLTKLYALAEKIEEFEKDIYVLADNALSAANSVIERANVTPYQPLKSACKKASTSVRDAKEITRKVRGKLAHQSETIREAAALYGRSDRIDRVN